MLKKKTFYISTLVLGSCLLITAVFLNALGGEELKAIIGICLGIGSGLAASSIVNLIMKQMENKNPELAKHNKVEYNDERNIFIRYKAKAKAADIMQWCIIGIAYITIAASSPLWVTLIIVCVFVLHNILVLFYTGKYQKEI